MSSAKTSENKIQSHVSLTIFSGFSLDSVQDLKIVFSASGAFNRISEMANDGKGRVVTREAKRLTFCVAFCRLLTLRE